MIGVTNNSPQQINAALIALKGEVKNEVKNEIINNIDNSVIGETYTAGDGIDITNAVISQTTDQLTFTGTQAQWEALTSAEKAKYGLVNRTDNDKGVYKNNNGTLELIAGRGDLTYPEGYVYTQYEGEQTPIQLGLQVPSGYQWSSFKIEYYKKFTTNAYNLIGYNKTIVSGSPIQWTATDDCTFKVAVHNTGGGYSFYLRVNDIVVNQVDCWNGVYTGWMECIARKGDVVKVTTDDTANNTKRIDNYGYVKDVSKRVFWKVVSV